MLRPISIILGLAAAILAFIDLYIWEPKRWGKKAFWR